MIKKYYSIFDKKAKFFSTPFTQVNDDVAIREFSDLVRDETLQPFKHPEDYKLYVLGSWDDQTGDITGIVVAEIASGDD
jgi:hypothetical protein